MPGTRDQESPIDPGLGAANLHKRLCRALQESLRPPPKLSLSGWAERFFRLSPESSAETGEFRPWGFQRGMLEAVKSGWVQRQIQDVAFERQREIEEGERIIVGVNEFEVDEDPAVDLEEVDPEQEAAQKERLAAVKADRDDDAVADALSGLREAAQGSENVMPHVVAAVKTYATVQEISDVLRDEFGEYTPGR